MQIWLRTIIAAAFVPTLALGAGCSDTSDVINTIDCHAVCQRYSDCFDASYDIDGCTDKCQSSADTNAERERKLKTCDACIGQRSCISTTFECTDDCVGIVP